MKKLFTLAAACLLFSQNSFAQCTAEILQTNPMGVCQGYGYGLTATPGGVSYQWMENGVPIAGANTISYNIPTTNTGLYAYTVEIDFGTCTDVSDPFEITVCPTPVVTATSNSPLCVGQTLNLVASSVPNLVYFWVGPQLYTSTYQNPIITNVQLADAGLYNVTGTQTTIVNGTPFQCNSATVSTLVQINPVPVVTATNTSPACPGSNVTLQANFISGAAYAWTGPNAFNSVVQNPLLVNVQQTSAGIYQVVAVQNGCTSAVASTTVSVNAVTPPPTVVSPAYCQGEPASPLQVTGSNILWYTTQVGGVGSPISPMPGTSIPGTTSFWVSQTMNGCESERVEQTVTVTPVPYITFITPTNPNFPAAGMITLSGLSPNTSYTVSYTQNGNPVTVTITSNVTGQIIITGLGVSTYDDFVVTLNGCSSTNNAGSYVLVEQNPGASYMWPGDVNWDMTADNNDVLDLGLSYGQTGTIRASASNNWTPQVSVDWGVAQINGADMKHADCNGDGIVNATDEDAVNQNYGMIHPKGVHLPQAKSAALPDLYFDLTGINFVEGTTVSVPIKLGTGTLPMNNILGIAAKIKVQNITLVNAPTVNNTTSWIGNGTNTMNFYKGVNSNQTDWALVRTDHNNVSGDGTIATLVMDIPVGSFGDAILYFEGVKIINNLGDVITDYNVVDDTATIIPVPVNLNSITNTSDKIVIVPNPSEGNADLQLSLSKNIDLQISITDISGREVWKKELTAGKGNSNITLPAAQLASGIYTIKIKGIDTPALKWIKK